MPYLLKALKLAHQAQASDLHLHPQAPLRIRRGRDLHPFQGDTPFSAEAIEKILAQVLSDDQWELLGRTGDVELEIHALNLARGRLHAFRDRAGFAAVVRVIAPEPPALEALELPAALGMAIQQASGLVVIAGARRCGKSATLAAIGRSLVEQRRPVHCFEEVIEFRLDGIGGHVAHRAVGRHAVSASAAITAAIKSGSAILVADLLAPEMTHLVLDAVEAGALVAAGLEAVDARDAICRLVLTAPVQARQDLRQRIAKQLAALLVLRRLPTVSGSMTLASELLLPIPAVRAAITAEDPHKLGAIARTSADLGMRSLDESLAQLVGSGTIARETAKQFARHKERFGRSS